MNNLLNTPPKFNQQVCPDAPMKRKTNVDGQRKIKMIPRNLFGLSPISEKAEEKSEDHLEDEYPTRFF